MPRSLSIATCCCLLVAATCAARDKTATPGQLRIFILAGQSNMTGYCGIMPLTNLANYDELEDEKLRKLDKRLCGIVFPSADAIRRNQELRAEIYKLNKTKQGNDEKINAATETKDQKTIDSLETRNKEIDAKVKELTAGLQVTVSERVYIAPDGRYGHRPGPLKFGYGRGKGFIGPEYGFGLSMERKIDAPILLIKVAQDGAALAYEYRPPSSGRHELCQRQKDQLVKLAKQRAEGKEVTIPDFAEDAGKDYRRTIAFTKEVLSDLKKHHPAYDPKAGYELTGFVWFQGWTDNWIPEYGARYAENMTNLIRDLRKDLDAPGLRVVCGTPSHARVKEQYDKDLAVIGLRAIARKPEFKDSVTVIETLQYYDHPIWDLYTKWRANYPEWHQVGSHVACHYLGSGRFFVRLGDALAGAMYEVMP